MNLPFTPSEPQYFRKQQKLHLFWPATFTVPAESVVQFSGQFMHTIKAWVQHDLTSLKWSPTFSPPTSLLTLPRVGVLKRFPPCLEKLVLALYDNKLIYMTGIVDKCLP